MKAHVKSNDNLCYVDELEGPRTAAFKQNGSTDVQARGNNLANEGKIGGVKFIENSSEVPTSDGKIDNEYTPS